MLDCPISGTGSQAKTKDLVVYASGDSKAIRKLKPLFRDSLARPMISRVRQRQPHENMSPPPGRHQQRRVGGGDGARDQAGLDPQTVFEMVTSGAGNSRVFELRAPMMVKDRYDNVTMKIAVWQKDMAVIGQFAREIGCRRRCSTPSVPVYNKAMKSGHAEQDTAAVCAVLEAMAGVTRKKGRSRS